MGAPGRPLTRRPDPRGVPCVTLAARVTGPAVIDALEELAAAAAVTPAQLAAQLIEEELWWVSNPGMRDHVRRARAGRRQAYADRQALAARRAELIAAVDAALAEARP